MFEYLTLSKDFLHKRILSGRKLGWKFYHIHGSCPYRGFFSWDGKIKHAVASLVSRVYEEMFHILFLYTEIGSDQLWSLPRVKKSEITMYIEGFSFSC